MPVIEGKIVNMETFPGKEGKADRRVIQVLETLGRMAELVDVADMSQGETFKEGQMVRLPAKQGHYKDRNGEPVITWTYFGTKSNGNGNGARPGEGGMLGK